MVELLRQGEIIDAMDALWGQLLVGAPQAQRTLSFNLYQAALAVAPSTGAKRFLVSLRRGRHLARGKVEAEHRRDKVGIIPHHNPTSTSAVLCLELP
jgi:hypothetical protein